MLAVSQIISKEGEACFLHLNNPSLNTKGHLTFTNVTERSQPNRNTHFGSLWARDTVTDHFTVTHNQFL